MKSNLKPQSNDNILRKYADDITLLVLDRDVARNLLRGQKSGSGDGSLPAGPGAEPRWGSAGAPEAGDTC